MAPSTGRDISLIEEMSLLRVVVAALVHGASGAWLSAARPSAVRRACTRRCAPFATATEDPALSVESQAAAAYGAALALAWRNDTTMLKQVVRPTVDVVTPLWKTGNRDEYEEALLELASFFGERATPTLTVLSQSARGDGSAQLSWHLSVEWPSIWRSRVNLVGESVLTFDPAAASAGALPAVRSVRETWHQSPAEAFVKQVLPRPRDIFTAWCSPTAEAVAQPVIMRKGGIELRRLPSMLALQAEWVESGDMLFMEQLPMAPSYAFTGEVKRAEWYSTVSPGMLERSLCTVDLPGGVTQTGQRRRWVLPLPARFGADPSVLPDPDGGADERPFPDGVVERSVQYVRRPAQTIAATRVTDLSNAAVLNAATKLAADVEAMGRRVVHANGRPVLMQLNYDLKYGYNKRKQLAMAVWLSVPKFLEYNEVAVLVEDD